MTAPNNYDLPEGVRNLADVIGREKALLLAGSYLQWSRRDRTQGKAGCLYVPRALPAEHRLRELLGNEAAEALARELGGELIHVSACRAVTQRWHTREAARLTGSGLLQVEVAAILGITDRTVRNLLAAA